MIKKLMKKNNKILISELKYNRCQIKLDDIESKFLSENIDLNNISLRNIEKAITKLYESSDIRYFRADDIENISYDLYETLKKKF